MPEPRDPPIGSLAVGLALLCACLPVVWAPDIAVQVVGVAGEVPRYLPWSAPLLLYVAAPIVTLSAFVFFLAPSLLASLAFARPRGFAEWILLSLGGSTCLSISFPALAQAVGAQSRGGKLAIWAGLSALAWCALAAQERWGDASPPPALVPRDRRRLGWSLSIVFAGVALLLPKLFWEDFNLDGLEAYEFGRSLERGVLPSWEMSRGVFGMYANFWTHAYPNHWFLTALGDGEWAIRLPFFLWLVGVLNALMVLIEHASTRALVAAEEAALVLGVACFATVMSFNATYEPFYSDIAEPSATDTLWMFLFLSTCAALWTRRRIVFFVFGLLTYGSSAGGLLLLGLLTLGWALFARADRATILDAAVLVACCGAIGLIHRLISPVVFGHVNDQFSPFNLLRRFFPPTLTEFVRLNALLLPSGILPAVSLLWTRRGDAITRSLAFIAASYFGALYVQAWTNLHQFVPSMLLPLAVFWRLHLQAPRVVQRVLLPVSGVAALVAIQLSLPPHFEIHRVVRKLGTITEVRVGDYADDYPTALRAARSLDALFSPKYRLSYPQQPFGVDSATWLHYASREKPAGFEARYVIQSADTPAPVGAARVATQDGFAVYVADLAAWKADARPTFPRVCQSPVYEPIYRHTYEFFRAWAERQRAGS